MSEFAMNKKNITEPGKTVLLIPLEKAREKLGKRLQDGKHIKDTNIHSEDDFKNLKSNYKKWSDYNLELLKRIFANVIISKEYEYASGPLNVVPDPVFGNPLPILYDNFINTISVKLDKLESIIERLELFPYDDITKDTVLPISSQFNNTDIFIVHGHDEESKQFVARVIEKLGLNAIILHEQVNKGRTIIKKFEDYSNVGFAVVILTPDDLCSSKKEKDNLLPRPRQNVIFELGFFLGKLGTERVCALKKGELELPSDYQGVLWIDMDLSGVWTFKLAKELKAVGYTVDLTKLI